MGLQVRSTGLVIVAAIAALCTPFAEGAAAIPAKWKNCTIVNKRFPHGVGRVVAHDRTSGEPVTTFKRNNYLYKTAMRYNRGLDRDKDGIACEKL
jgi:hypothetical protein